MANKKGAIAQYFEDFLNSIKEKENEELLISFRGVLYPERLCSPETFEALETMEARKDDVLIVAYPKCGPAQGTKMDITISNSVNYKDAPFKSTRPTSRGGIGTVQMMASPATATHTGTNWMLHIMNEMIAAVPSNKDLPPPDRFQMLEFGPPEKFQTLKNQPSPRVFATHLLPENIPKSFFQKKTKILVIFRNPKDAAVSYFHFYNKNPVLPSVTSWDEFFQMFMSGEVCFKSYFDHALAWDKHIDDENIKIITFEDMKENLYEGVKQIAEFYELSLPDETIQSIADKASFQEMNNRSSETHGSFAPVLFRKGAVGDWKTLFTEAQSKEMDAKFEECLAGTKLGALLKYDKLCTF